MNKYPCTHETGRFDRAFVQLGENEELDGFLWYCAGCGRLTIKGKEENHE